MEDKELVGKILQYSSVVLNEPQQQEFGKLCNIQDGITIFHTLQDLTTLET